MDVKGVPVLVSAEAGLPYRTSICVVERYDFKHPDYDQLRQMLNAVGETVRVLAR